MASSRYAWAQYGESFYGAPDEGALGLLWVLEIDWDNDGIFNGGNEAIYMSSLTLKRGRDYLIKSTGDGFERLDVGEFTATLENYDLRFSPDNPQSPLYPNILPLRQAKLWCVTPAGNTYEVMRGRVSDIQPIEGSTPRVRVTVRDGLQFLRDHAVRYAITQNETTDDAIDHLLTTAGWAEDAELDVSTIHIPYWWGDGRSVYEQLNELVEGELGTYFVANDGTFKFFTRHHTYASEATLTSDTIQRAISASQPWEVVRNEVRVTAHPLALSGTLTDIWRLQDKPPLNASQTLVIWGDFKSSGDGIAASGVVAPVATTDFTVNTSVDGTGTNLTASCTVAATIYGSSVKLEITNNSANSGYITMLKVRGYALSAPFESTILAEDANSIAAYGRRTLNLDLPWQQNTNTAIDFANYLTRQFAFPRTLFRVTLRDLPDTQFGIDLFDLITLSVPSLWVNADFRVVRIAHKWVDRLGSQVETELLLEPFTDTTGQFWQFPTKIGETSVFSF